MKLEVKNQCIEVTQPEALVSGTVNVYTAEFSFDSTWDGYKPVAVFEGSGSQGCERREVAIIDGAAVIPWEVLLPDSRLRVGVYGISGDKRLPTVYTDRPLFVARGAEGAGASVETTPDLMEQLLALAAADRRAAEEAARRVEEKFAAVGGEGGDHIVISACIKDIVVIDAADYDALAAKSETTLYLIRG